MKSNNYTIDGTSLNSSFQADDMIDMAFGKKRVADRKNWLLALEPGRLKRFMHHRLFLCDLSLVDLKN